MKHLIPIGFAFAGAFLVGLPLYSQIVAMDLIVRVINPAAGGPSFSSVPFAPLLHLFIPWITGAVLIGSALYFALKSYREG